MKRKDIRDYLDLEPFNIHKIYKIEPQNELVEGILGAMNVYDELYKEASKLQEKLRDSLESSSLKSFQYTVQNANKIRNSIERIDSRLVADNIDDRLSALEEMEQLRERYFKRE